MPVADVVLAEWKLLPRRMGGAPAIMLYIAFLGILGWWLPSGLGFGFLDPHMILMYSCAAPFFMMTVVTGAFFDYRETAPPRAMLAGKIVAWAIFGWLSSLLLLTTGLATVNITGGFGQVVLPDTSLLVSVQAIGLWLALMTAALGAVIALGAGDESIARGRLRRILLLLLVLAIAVARFGPVSWRDTLTGLLIGNGVVWFAAAACAVLAGLTTYLFRRAAAHPRYSDAVE